jgi:hypothetical protein
LRKSCATYERKTRGPRMGREGNNPIHINVSVEPINPCATNTPKRTPPFRQPEVWKKSDNRKYIYTRNNNWRSQFRQH